ncbi:F-box/LRR-repeat protein At4g14103-like [Rosa rugosa]|uniref:F-box/LRR-repeat protein At4g14103-like n=1 Tax=Rosa rugosa TaxID=74645 RepID=UPI002B40B1FB|nr:F-box/LRR-repeat protein At4g14103-like [Rosa rugosa]XP_062011806.1 F-box/LRR-repeat protein At4g14103-like [Rosa rugosa]
MNSKSKRQLRVPDRISGLPDALLWHILSFVETQDAVRTCVLSTRWKNIWASVPTLDFDQTSFHDPDKFWAFVDSVLLFRHSSNIKKFRLYMKGKDVDHSRINAWINTAIRRNVVELDLLAGHPFLSKLVELPKSLFMCKTLVILRLRSQFITNIPASGCFPSLKFLHVTFYSNVIESMRELFSNCPILEDLTVDGLLLYGVSLNLNISVPSLKTLRIWFDKDGDDNGASSYFINCPKLENLDVTEEFSSTYCWGKAKSLVKASICLPQHCSNGQPSFYRVKSLLAGISSVTDLCLSAHCFEVGSLPAYENLRRLKLVIQDCFCWELLTKLLKRSPILESLVLECEVDGCPQEDSDNDEGSLYEEDSESEEGSEHEEGSENERRSDHEEGSVNEQGSEHQWNPPDCVPKCCLLHLKIVSIRGFMGERDELEVAKYLLKYGKVLNKMTISMDHLDVNEKEKIYKEFLMVPRGSRTSIVEFM